MANYSSYTDIVSATTWSAGEAAIRSGNTVAWYDFTDTSTITQSGGRVSLWKDRLLSGNDLAQGTALKQPQVTATGILFTPATGEILKTATFTYDRPSQIYLVVNLKTWATSAGIIDGNAAGSGLLYCHTGTPKVQAYAGAGLADVDLSVGDYHIVRILFNGANSKIIIDGNAAVTGNTGAADMDGITVGGWGNVGNYSNIEIKEAVFRNIADSAPNETAIFNYLNTKYGLGL